MELVEKKEPERIRLVVIPLEALLPAEPLTAVSMDEGEFNPSEIWSKEPKISPALCCGSVSMGDMKDRGNVPARLRGLTTSDGVSDIVGGDGFLLALPALAAAPPLPNGSFML